MERIPTILLTGTVGSGKTAVAAEIGLALEERELPVAIIDLDWLAWVHLDPAFAAFGTLIVENLSAIWPNLRAAGARYFVLVRAIPDGLLLGPLRAALPEADITVVRLTASPKTIAERLRRRDAGAVLAEHLGEHVSMTEAMDRAGVEDFVVVNDRRPIREVALEILRRAGWVDSAGADPVSERSRPRQAPPGG